MTSAPARSTRSSASGGAPPPTASIEPVRDEHPAAVVLAAGVVHRRHVRVREQHACHAGDRIIVGRAARPCGLARLRRARPRSSTRRTPTTPCRSASIAPRSSSRSRSATSTSPRRGSRSRTTSLPRSPSSRSAATRAGSAGWARCPSAPAARARRGGAARRSTRRGARAAACARVRLEVIERERPLPRALYEKLGFGSHARTRRLDARRSPAPRITEAEPGDPRRRARLDRRQPAERRSPGSVPTRRSSTWRARGHRARRRSIVERDGETVRRARLPERARSRRTWRARRASDAGRGAALSRSPRRGSALRGRVERAPAGRRPPTAVARLRASRRPRRGAPARDAPHPLAAAALRSYSRASVDPTASGVSTGEEDDEEAQGPASWGWSRLLGVAALALATSVAAGPKAAPFKVAWIYPGPHNDGGWSQAHDAGRLYVQKMLGNKVQTTYKENVFSNASVPADRRRPRSRRLQDDLRRPRSACSSSASTASSAKKYPNVLFEQATGTQIKKNQAEYFGAAEDTIYLSGMAAGAATKKGVIGYVVAVRHPRGRPARQRVHPRRPGDASGREGEDRLDERVVLAAEGDGRGGKPRRRRRRRARPERRQPRDRRLRREARDPVGRLRLRREEVRAEAVADGARSTTGARTTCGASRPRSTARGSRASTTARSRTASRSWRRTGRR